MLRIAIDKQRTSNTQICAKFKILIQLIEKHDKCVKSTPCKSPKITVAPNMKDQNISVCILVCLQTGKYGMNTI